MSTASVRARPGRYMVFTLGQERYGVEILKVRELIALLEITRVPGASPAVVGVVNLRGKVVPVVDLRVKFGMGQTPLTPHTVIIVLEHHAATGGEVLGVLVDEVLDVLALDEGRVEPPPRLDGLGINPDFIVGVGKQEKKVIFLLDIDLVLSAQERASLAPLVPNPSSEGAPR